MTSQWSAGWREPQRADARRNSGALTRATAAARRRAPQQRRADRYNGLMRVDGFSVCAAAGALRACAVAAAR